MIQFKSEAQRACHEQVSKWMKEIFGELAASRNDAPLFGVALGSAFAQVAVLPWGQDDAVICTRAYVVTGAEMTPELIHYLLRQNASMGFGAFGLDDDVFFDHTIVGSTCSKNELKASVVAVVGTADRLDDEIVARWGGQRALDRVRS
jgi:hypothetical protein